MSYAFQRKSATLAEPHFCGDLFLTALGTEHVFLFLVEVFSALSASLSAYSASD
jgi:hypothetical protein